MHFPFPLEERKRGGGKGTSLIGESSAVFRCTVLLRKKGLLDYEPKSRNPLGPIYLRNSFSLKGLTPGEYEYDIILRDENEPGSPVIQSLEFRVVAPVLPEPSKDAK